MEETKNQSPRLSEVLESIQSTSGKSCEFPECSFSGNFVCYFCNHFLHNSNIQTRYLLFLQNTSLTLTLAPAL